MTGDDLLDDAIDPLLADLRHAYGRRTATRAVRDEPWKQDERARFRRLLEAAGARSLLEIGAGHGASGRYVADAGFDVVCTDLYEPKRFFSLLSDDDIRAAVPADGFELLDSRSIEPPVVGELIGYQALVLRTVG